MYNCGRHKREKKDLLRTHCNFTKNINCKTITYLFLCKQVNYYIGKLISSLVSNESYIVSMFFVKSNLYINAVHCRIMISLDDFETYLMKNGMVVLNTFLGLVSEQWGEIVLQRSIPNLMQLHFH